MALETRNLTTMAAMSDQPIAVAVGERIKFWREASRRTKVSVAARAGISEIYLYEIERGVKTPTLPTLMRLASALGVSVSALVAEPSPASADPSPWAAPIAAAMLDYGPPVTDVEPDLIGLRDRFEALYSTWGTSANRFSATAPALPNLIRETSAATRYSWTPAQADQRRQAHRIACEVYGMVRPAAKWFGRPDLALMAGERALTAAEAADDPVRIGLAKWHLAQALSMTGEAGDVEHVEHIALGAGRELDRETKREGPDQVPALTVQAMNLLLAGLAAGRQADPFRGLAVISQAAPIADQVGEVPDFGLSFGPTNLLVWRVALLTEAGEAADALRVADDVDLTRLQTVERRASHLLAIAQANSMRSDDGAALVALMQLEATAPEDARHRPLSHELVRGLLHRARPSMAAAVRELALKLGVYA